jgi:ATP-dependent phosphofructokinase / diphosphate-dependent phosphofructokinase
LSSSTHGNLVIGQAGGATAVINASLVGAFEAASTDERIGGIYGMRFGVEGLLKGDLIDLRRQSADLWPRLLHTPSAALGSSQYKLKDGDLERIIAALRHYTIRYFLYIGGNGSADTVHRVMHTAHRERP